MDEIRILPGGGRGRIRITRVDSDDPGADVLQVEVWQVDAAGDPVSDAEGIVEAPVRYATINRGALADGLDLDAILAAESAQGTQRLTNVIAARAKLRTIPAGVRRDKQPPRAIADPGPSGPS